MNRADVAMVNQSLQHLSDSLLRRRMLDEEMENARQNRAQRNLDRQQRGGIAQEEQQLRRDTLDATKQYHTDTVGAQKQHYTNMEAAQRLRTAFDALKNSQGQMQEGITFLGEQVRSGALTNEQATEIMKASVNALPPDLAGQLEKDPTFATLLMGKGDWQAIAPAKLKPEVNDPALVSMDKAAETLEQKAAESQQRGEDPQIAKAYLSRAKALRSRIATRPDRPFTRKFQDPNDPDASITQRMTQEELDAEMAKSGAAAGKATLRMVRDPKTGKLVPAK